MIYLFIVFELITFLAALYFYKRCKDQEMFYANAMEYSCQVELQILSLQKKNDSLMGDLERARVQRDGAMNDLRKAQEIIKAETELDSVRALCQEVRELRLIGKK